MPLQIPGGVVRMIEDFEGFRATQYDDGTGVMTIGYGTTSADVNPLPRQVTRQEADQLLRRMLREKYLPAIERLNLGLNVNQVGALLSFDYNLGSGFLSGDH